MFCQDLKKVGDSRKARKARGAALVEFALMAPLLLGLCMAATDFGRLFFHAVTIANAAGTGAFFGARDVLRSGDFGGQEQRALDDTRNLSNSGTTVTASAEQYCTCPGDGVKECDDTTIQCAGYGAPRGYIKVTVQQPFPMWAQWPLLPKNATVGRTAFMRGQ